MLQMKQVVQSFPSVRIASVSGGLPVEISVIAQMGHGAGDHMVASIAMRQSKHENFLDELDEPSAKLGGTDFSKDDLTSLYSFMVGPNGHPFHRHVGHRIFTAISGSGGAQLRFSSASIQDMAQNPQAFLQALRFINIPPDCMFTVRFGGETWHQFAPLHPRASHPVLFAVSCHSNELGGDLSEETQRRIRANEHSIPALTELLPVAVQALLDDSSFKIDTIPVTTLALDAPDGTLHRLICNLTRGRIGKARSMWGAWKRSSGFLSNANLMSNVEELDHVRIESLLSKHLADVSIDYEDAFCLSTTHMSVRSTTASKILASLLEGFLTNRPTGVARLMTLRNTLVRPLGLRTSPLGCPVSSLLTSGNSLFFDKYPVLDQRIGDKEAEIVLGADDKHLQFRSGLGVKIEEDGRVIFTLANRVHCKNRFGNFYMDIINRVHRHYIAPTMLRMATDYAITYSS